MHRVRLSFPRRSAVWLCALAAPCFWSGAAGAALGSATPATTRPTVAVGVQTVPGEQVPSEDPIIKDFHSLGLVNGELTIFRCACPVRDLGKRMSTTQPSAAEFAEARARLQHLHDLGIRTIFSFQSPTSSGDESKQRAVANAVALERSAAEAVGIRYVSRPMNNKGPDSFQTMTDQQVIDLVQPVVDEIFAAGRSGGVAFHCTAGHDRAGLVAAYIRIKYEHWSAEQAIAEMRRLGHNWEEFSDNGGVCSWHEQHLRGIAAMLNQATASR